LRRAYRVASWTSPTHFLEQVARNQGKLLKGGEPDLNSVAKSILFDWQRGRIPYFAPPPSLPPSEDVLAAVRDAKSAKNGGGGVSENASKSERDAAEAMTQTARDLLVKQVNRRIPRANGLFDAEDARDDEIEDVEIESSDDEEDEDALDEDDEVEEVEDERGQTRKRSRAAAGSEEDDDEDEDGGEASESEDVEIDDDEDGPGLDDKILDKFGSDDDDEEEEEDDKDKDEKDDDGDSDSDGYGEAGLSFESILADVRGDIKEKPAAPAGGGKSSARAKKKQAVVAKKKPAATKKKNREVRKGTVSFIKDNAGVDASSSQKKKKAAPARRPKSKRSDMLEM
jgi:nuclear GTP-binding protein